MHPHGKLSYKVHTYLAVYPEASASFRPTGRTSMYAVLICQPNGALRAPSERLDACGCAIYDAALRVDDAATLVAFDHLGDHDITPRAQPRPPALPRAHRIAKGLNNTSVSTRHNGNKSTW